MTGCYSKDLLLPTSPRVGVGGPRRRGEGGGGLPMGCSCCVLRVFNSNVASLSSFLKENPLNIVILAFFVLSVLHRVCLLQDYRNASAAAKGS